MYPSPMESNQCRASTFDTAQEAGECTNQGTPRETRTTAKPVVMLDDRRGGTLVCKELLYAYAVWENASFLCEAHCRSRSPDIRKRSASARRLFTPGVARLPQLGGIRVLERASALSPDTISTSPIARSSPNSLANSLRDIEIVG
jgi:hypothetical protein